MCKVSFLINSVQCFELRELKLKKKKKKMMMMMMMNNDNKNLMKNCENNTYKI